MTDALERQLEAIVKHMMTIDLHYRRPIIVIEVDGKICLDSIWTNEDAKKQYNDSMAIVIELRAMIQKEKERRTNEF